MFHHNKKRNLLVVETAVAGLIAESILCGDDAKINAAKSVFLKYLGKGELKKELSVAKTLFEGNVQTRNAALNVLDKAKSFAKTIDVLKLDAEKTLFIHEAQREIPEIFQRKVDGYDQMVSVQLLLNYWMKGALTESILGIVAIEEQCIDHLTRTAKSNDSKILEESADKVDLVSSAILEAKIDDSFANLSIEQKQMLRAHAVGDFVQVTNIARNGSRRLLEKLQQRQWDSGKTEDVRILEKELEGVLTEGWTASEQHTAFLLSFSDIEKELEKK
jgi:hypothetical protein